ncbi:tetratricopeptide repeat protein [Clostridium estertheticum]|uniref:tetratricopeptide repeat protein n=1 Tax=Clostridium estertheticum TaxID=238834 RepID=UPI001CF10601|nr:tetratricopeptide repeat protein [Clostridium estertheticum]MCB2306726.1 tetratricopeptide repeat protein [Clostridium estertheticum]MCB2346669.1 tetratricopeptide repeat protein [Clostridium estertheticum]MCB2350232.1 tetratricopeptide repeat protein [Clostridium estertheticum]WAG47202.1 tetratricopeptide repeat protein [Clostridium estertheticum]
MDKSGKIYVKAMNKYNDGYIDKALDLCEKSISLKSTNAAALNLKGILYYLKGDLENAKKMWDINYKRNNDKVSKKYLSDSLRDKKRLQLYINSLELIKQLNICEALETLEQCQDSDFNFINVNNNISLCYIKQGEYDKALQHINEVIKVDKKNAEASINKETLIKYGSLKRKINYVKIGVVTASILLIITVTFIGKKNIYDIKHISAMSAQKLQSGISLIKGNDKLVAIKKNTNLDKSGTKMVGNKVQKVEQFPREQFKISIENNNMEQIVSYVNRWNKADLGMNDKLLMVKGEEIIKREGVLYFYNKGVGYIKDKEYTKAQKYLLYALPYSKGDYLQEHILYMLAVSYKASSDFQNAVKYYELILKQFPSGSYTEEVLYNLVLINKDVDLNKAKFYAEKLVEQFPDSLYKNSIVKKILGI